MDHVMKAQLQRTFSPTPSDIQRSWYVIDADDVPLGRLASEVAQILRGKNKPTYAPHMDGGDFVVVINAAKVHVSGNKEFEKIYYRHSGYPGGLRAETLSEVREKYPERLVEIAVRGMLPKNRLGRQMLRKLKVHAGPDHPHQSQKPESLQLKHRKVDA
jgi:large subunit ribosomal protein L13